MAQKILDVPVAHIDDDVSISALLAELSSLHGAGYDFAVERWAGGETVMPLPGKTIYRFLIESEGASLELRPGDLVRGPEPGSQVLPVDDSFSRVVAQHQVELWPGDVVCVNSNDHPAILHGKGAYFEVITEATDYRTPRVAHLRNLASIPGGCAAYPGAFRREALPPQRPAADAADRRGINRVNEHTLDMRIDREPPPIRHYHGPISMGESSFINHSETAIVLPRAVYGLPEVDRTDEGHIVVYRRPAEDPTDTVTIPVRPGSIVVTPATTEVVMGHAFENCFAMLVAIPGFVAPYNIIG